MVIREKYINQLLSYIDKPFVKVITGIRRSGKSYLLMMLKDELIKKGTDERNILYLNFESFNYVHIAKAEDLYNHIKSKITGSDKYYLLLDEIQEVHAWEKAINALRVDFNTDITLTGSNSRMLSGELATFLAGRYVEIPVYTLSFDEFLIFRNEKGDCRTRFEQYLHLGGFPAIHSGNFSVGEAHKIVFDIYSSVILRDVVQRNNIRDIELLERVVKFLFDNIGNKFSAKNIADYFKSQQRKIDLNTVYNYLNALESAFIIYRIPRYDVKGKEILKTNEKYFIGDQSLFYALIGYRETAIAGILENIVMLELKRRGFKVFTGKIDNLEIDFIAEKAGKKIYIQVCYRMIEKSTIEREFMPLLKIRDNFTKYVITMDPTWKETYEGILHKYIADFLLMKEI